MHTGSSFYLNYLTKELLINWLIVGLLWGLNDNILVIRSTAYLGALGKISAIFLGLDIYIESIIF